MPTLWVVLICVLQVVLHRLLPDHLLNLPLRINIEWIVIQQSHLLHAVAFSTLVVTHHLKPNLAESVAVIDRLCQSRPLLPHLSHGGGIPQYVQSCSLDAGW
jgi:hypothetical protein